MEDVSRIRKASADIFGENGTSILVRSPGRVNLIGEHTDYNEGFVLPAAIDRGIVLSVTPRPDDRCRLFAVDLGREFSTSLSGLRHVDEGWPNYILGVVDQLQKAGHRLRGFTCAFGGNVPIGAGMSSSAAIEGGIAYALNRIFRLGIDTLDLVKLAQRAENEFVGVRCGVMDQFVNLFGRERKVIKLDCRSLGFDYLPFERTDVRIVLCDTRVRRALASSEYNVRRQQCEEGVAVLRRHDEGMRSLRDVPLAVLEEHRNELSPVVFRRCAYVVKENERVGRACQDLLRNDLGGFGAMMYLSHEGLRDEYEVSCRELDALVDAAASIPGVFGARMMGAGFGGCTINLVEEPHLEEFMARVQERYTARMGSGIVIHTARIDGGTAEIIDGRV